MSTEFNVDGKIYMSTKRLAEISGYASDHISRLCREGKIECKQIGRNWFANKDSLLTYKELIEQENNLFTSNIKNKETPVSDVTASKEKIISKSRPSDTIAVQEIISTKEIISEKNSQKNQKNKKDIWSDALFSFIPPTSSTQQTGEESFLPKLRPKVVIDLEEKLSPKKSWLPTPFVSLVPTIFSSKIPTKVIAVFLITSLIISGVYLRSSSSNTYAALESLVANAKVAIMTYIHDGKKKADDISRTFIEERGLIVLDKEDEVFKKDITKDTLVKSKSLGLTAQVEGVGEQSRLRKILNSIASTPRAFISRTFRSIIAFFTPRLRDSRKIIVVRPLPPLQGEDVGEDSTFTEEDEVIKEGIATTTDEILRQLKILALFNNKNIKTSKTAIEQLRQELTLIKTQGITVEASAVDYGIVERLVRQFIPKQGPTTNVTQSDLDNLKNELQQEILSVANTAQQNTATVYRTVSLTQRIDQLANLTISNATITGSSFSGSLGSFTSVNTGTLSVSGATTLNGVSYTWPSADGSSNHVLSTNGAGVLSWVVQTGGGGSGLFATTSDSLALHPIDISDVLIIGGTSTSTTGNIFEVIGSSLFRGTFTVYNTVTAPSFVATSTSATSTFINLSLSGNSELGTVIGGVWNGTSLADAYIDDTITASNYLSLANWFATTTDGLDEGLTNFYYSDSKVDARINASSTIPNVGGSSYGDLLSWTGSLWETRATSTLATALTDTTGTLLATRGGTGLTSYVIGDLIYANAANSLARLATSTAGSVLQLDFGTGLPSYVATSTLNIALTNTTGTLDVNRGGTGTTSFSAGGIVFSDGSVLLDDTAGFFYDDTNNRLGLGSTTPYAKLSITANAGQTAPLFQVANSTDEPFLTIASTGGLTQTNGEAFITGGIKDGTNLSGAWAVHVSGKYAYVTSSGDNSLQIIDISDPINPVIVGGVKDNINLTAPLSIYISGQYAYVGNYSDNSLRIIDISDPTNPSIIGGIKDDSNLDNPRGVYVSGKYAYVVNETDDSLRIIDISDPTNPVIVGGVKDTANLDGAWGVYVSGKYAYVAAFADTSLRIIDISDPTNPIIVGGVKDATNLSGITSVYVSGRYAYVTSSLDDSLQIIDVKDPANPSIVGGIKDGADLNEIWSVYVSGKYAYVVNSLDDSLRIIDVSSSTAPTIVGGIKPGVDGDFNRARGVYVSGKYAYVASELDNSLRIIDIGGLDVPAAHIGDLAVGTIDVWENLTVANNAYIQNGLGIGIGGLFSQGSGAFSTFATTSLANQPVLTAIITDSNNASVVDIFNITHSASSSASDGIGAGLLFSAEDDTGSATSTARIASILTDVTNTTPTSVLTFSTKNISGSLTEYMRLDNLGNLGLGTTSPYAKLSVVGEVVAEYFTATSTSATSTFTNFSLSGNSELGTIISGLWQGTAILPAFGGTGLTSNPTFGQILQGNATSGYDLVATSTLGLGDGTFIGLIDTPGTYGAKRLVFTNSGATALIDDANLVFDGTNFGIGTTSPYAKLSVAGEIVAAFFTGTTTATSTLAGGWNITNGCFSVGGTCVGGGSDNFLGLTDTQGAFNANRIIFTNSAGDALIDNSNFVFNGTSLGVGTTSPSARIAITGVAGQTTPLFQVASSTDTPFFTITKDGSIGIDTTSPEFKLSLESDGGILAKGSFGTGTTLTTAGAGTRMLWYPRKAAFRVGRVSSTQWDDASVGDYSAAFNRNTTASGDYSVAFGSGTTASAFYSFVVGLSSTASNFGSIAFGDSVTSSGTNSTAFGFNTQATGDYTLVSGVSSVASGSTASALGQAVTASGDYSTALGFTTTADAYISTVLGRYNVGGGNATAWVDTDPLFEVGIGTGSGAKANALTILKGGNVGIGTSSPYAKLSITGQTVAEYFTATSTSATSTFTNLSISGNSELSTIISGLWNGTEIGPLFGGTGLTVAPTFGQILRGNAGSGYDLVATSTLGIDLSDTTGLLTVSRGGTGVSSFNAGGIIFSSGSILKDDTAGFFYDDTNNRLGLGSTTPFANLTITGTAGQTAPLFQVASSTDTPFLTITSDGLVGIGTSTPTEKLTLHNGTFLQTEGDPIKVGGVAAASIAYDVYVSGRYAYVVSFSPGDDLEIFDISDPTNPTKVGGVGAPTTARGVHVSGKYAYVISESTGDDDDLEIFDISDPTNPTKVGGVGAASDALDVYVSGKYAYVVSESGGDDLEIFDISDPTNPTKVGGVGAASTAYGVYVSGKYAYVVTNSSGGDDDLEIFDISDPTNPTKVGGVPAANTAWSVYVSGKYAYVVTSSTGGDDDLEIFNISDPTDPQKVGGVAAADSANDVYVSGKYAYVVTNSAGDDLEIFDISDPTNPTKVGSVGAASTALGVYISGKYAYVVTTSTGDDLEIFDISGIDTPAANIGNLASNNVNISENLTVANNAYIQNGLGIGGGGLFSQGSGVFSTFATTSRANQPVLTAIITDSNNSSVVDLLNLVHKASSTAANGIGSGLLFSAEFDYGIGLPAGTSTARIASIFTNISSTSPASVLTFSTKNISGSLTEYMRLDNLGNLGIGTASPSMKLTLEDSGGHGIYLDRTVDGTGGGIGVGHNTSQGLAIFVSDKSPNAPIVFGFNQTEGNSNPFVGLQEKMRIDSSGNVGIGTTSPYAKLSVSGNAGQTAPLFQVASSTDTPFFTVTNLGNVGIGTASPGKKLDVNGVVAFSANTDGKNTFEFSTQSLNEGRLRIKAVDTVTVQIAAGSDIPTYFNGGNIGIGTTSPYAKLSVSGNAGQTAPLFQVASSTDAPFFTVTNLGNVGIGTASPGTTLDIKKTSSGDSIFRLTRGSGQDFGLQITANQGAGNVFIDSIGDNAAPKMFFRMRTLGTPIDAMTIDGAGNVGIGTTSPGSLLSLEGISNFTTATSTFYSTGGINLTGGGCFSISGTCVGGGGGGGAFTSSGGFTILDTIADNVGIGTTSPYAKLTVSGNAGQTAPLFQVASSTDTPFLTIASTGGLEQSIGDPFIVGGVQNFTTLDSVRSVYVLGKYAYVAGRNDSSLSIIDISDPANPSIIGGVKDTLLSGIQSVYVSGKYAYVANGNDDSLRIIDISDPVNPSIVGGVKDASLLEGAYAVYVSGKYAYVVSDFDDSLRIIDVSDPTNPIIVGGVKDASLLEAAQSVYVSGKYAYVANLINDSLRIIDVSDPTNPIIVGGVKDASLLDGAHSVYVSGKYAYVANNIDDSLRIIDISDPTNPSIVGGVKDASLLNGASSVYVGGKYAYVTSKNDDSLRIIDISSSTAPTIVGGIKDSTDLFDIFSVYVSGKYAYVIGKNDASLRIIDIGGLDTPAAHIGDLAAGTIDVWENLTVANNAYIQNGLGIGVGGLFSQGSGAFSIFATTSLANQPVLTAIITDSNNASVVDLLNLVHKASSTAANGIGSGLLFSAELNPIDAATTTATSTARIAALLTNAAEATPTSVLTFSTKNISGSLTEYMRLDNLGNLGIGTTSPSAVLEVNGDFRVGEGSNYNGLFVDATNGRVGIGTASPAANLEVNAVTNPRIRIMASSTSSAALDIFAGTGLAFGQIKYQGTDNDLIITNVNADNDSDIIFVVQDVNEAMRIKGSGNVGIGTTSPGSLFSVNGITNFTTATSTFYSTGGINLTGGGCFSISGTCVGGGGGSSEWTDSGTFLYSSETSDSVVIGASSLSASNGLLALFATSTTGNLLFASSTASFTGNFLQFVNSAGVEQAAISASGDLTLAGDLTINGGDVIYGTAATSTIADNQPFSWTIATSTTADPIIRIETSTGDKATTTITGGFIVDAGAIEYVHSTGVTSIDNLELGSLNFETDAGIVSWVDMTVATTGSGIVESYTAQLDGNSMLTIYGTTDGSGGVNNLGVGIGTTSPGSLLSLEGIANFTTATSTFYSTGGINLTGGGCFSISGTCVGGGGGGGAFTSSGGFTTLNTIADNVGIGTTSPYAKLSVSGNAGQTAPLFQVASSTDSPFFTITEDGKVGIGTDSPSVNLEVFNGGGGHSILQLTSSSNNSKIYFRPQSGGSQFNIEVTGSSFKIRDVDNAVDVFVIENEVTSTLLYLDEANKVGISSTTPWRDFSVEGTVGFSSTLTTGTGQALNISATTYEVIRNTSSERYKEDITNIELNSKDIYDLVPRSFTWKTDTANAGQRDFGLIAEEVYTIIPELVWLNSEGQPEAVRYDMISVLLLNEVQKRNAVIDTTAATTTFASMFIDGEGNVGIGTTSPQYKLHVIGDVAATGFINTSTRDAKKDIRALDENEEEAFFEKIKTLKLFSYNYTYEKEGAKDRLGLIAEEAPEEVLSEDGKGVDIYKLVTFTLGGVKTLAKKFDELMARIVALEEAVRVGVVATIDSSITNFNNIFTSTLTVYNQLCIGGTCINELQLKTLLENAGLIGATIVSATSTGTTTQTTGDISPPVITLNGANPAEIDLNSIYSDLGVIVTDNVDNNLGHTITVDGVLLSTGEVINIDTSLAGEHTITFSATDQAGNSATSTRIVIVGNPMNNASTTPSETVASTTSTVSDTVAPIIILIGSSTIEIIVGEQFIDEGATASDETDGDISGDIIIEGIIDTTTEGTYSVTYNVSDSANNAAQEVTRTVTVREAPMETPLPDTDTASSSQATTTPSN